MKSQTLLTILSCTAFAAGSATALTISPGDPLVPAGLNPGDTFQLIINTGTNDAPGGTSVTIADVNTFANNVANNVGYSGSVVASLGATWFAIASTADVNARDNAVVLGPVYRVDGVKVADDLDDMWDGQIDATLDLLVDGVTTSTEVVRTGTTSSGLASSRPFGASRIDRGVPNSTTDWIGGGGNEASNGPRRSVYALSEVITVAVVPEPSSLALLGLGGMLIARRRRS